MIVHDCEQYSHEWWALRLGIPTASRFSSIITDKTKKPSSSRFALIADILIEERFAKPSDYREGEDQLYHGFGTDGTPWMKRGSEIEDEARTWYQLHTGTKVETVGFIMNDARTAGCSPDGIAPDRGLEIKCRSAKYHQKILLGYDQIAESPQVQGSMWVTGLDRWDVLAYCPGMPARLERTYRDPSFTVAFEKAFNLFVAGLKDAREAMARIEQDVIEVDNLAELYSAAIQKKPTRPNPMTIDDLAELGTNLQRCSVLGMMDASDVLQVIDDAWAEDWHSVQNWLRYTIRSLEAAVARP